MKLLKRWFALALIAALIAAPAAAEDAGAPQSPSGLVNVEGRAGAVLSGAWHYIVDRQDVGYSSGRLRSFYRDFRPADQALVEYDWAASPIIDVPGDWNSQVEPLRWYDGLVWFQRTFKADPQPHRRYFLDFEAVNYRASVYLNGERIGGHVGGFTPFAIEVTGKLKTGDNVLVVGADNRHDAQTIPSTEIDWWNYGGITRPVHLVSTPETFVRSYAVQLRRDGRIAADVALDGPVAAGERVTVSIPALKLTLAGRTDANGTMRADIAAPAALERWSPTDPKLYAVAIRAGDDAIDDRIGFRTIEVRGDRILLNGKPIFLRGVAMHEETLGDNPTRAASPAQIRALLAEAKALGANFVRLAHYPHNARTTRLADEMGLMVWSEIPVYWNIAFDDPHTLALARTMLAENMQRDANRASIIIWSVGNETPRTAPRLTFMRRLIDDAHARDPGRLVTAALDEDADTSSGPDGIVRVDDPLGAYVDVLAMNRYEGWYGDRTPPQIDAVNWTVAYDKPVILSEFGAGALYGYRAGPLVRWSEEYQRSVYRHDLLMADRIPHLAGTSAWVLKDFRSPRRFHGRFQQYWNRKGLIDPTGRHKLAWQVLHDWYVRKAAAGR